MILVSAIHFKAPWKHRFEKDATANETFTLINGTKLQVPMMRQMEEFRSGSSGDFIGISLPYKGGGNMSMLVLLPNETSENIMKLSTRSDVLRDAVRDSASWKRANTFLKLPRFEIATSLDASSVMKQLGATDLFDSSLLDLSPMLGVGARAERIRVSSIFHRALVTVDEEGTEAAAVTRMDTLNDSDDDSREFFFVNRPFLFCICSSDTILFVGNVMNPLAVGL